ncbi:hypothetical protein GCM10010377_36500 [Streptomyces viridiviolaceus]|nr:hypothetical protein GCM10010377_36500 [Streptomyces viridiviolaceus]
MGRASKIMAPTSCFNGQVHRLPDAPEAYGAMITRPKAAPAQSRSTDCVLQLRSLGAVLSSALPSLALSLFAVAVICKVLASKLSTNQDTKTNEREENRMADESKSSRMKQWASATCDVLGDLVVGFAGGAVSS